MRERIIMAAYHATWAESRDRRASDQADAIQSETAEQGRYAEYRDLAMSLDVAGPDFTKRLQVDQGEPAVSRGFIRYADNQPLSLQVSYYPMDIAREAATRRDRRAHARSDRACKPQLGFGTRSCLTPASPSATSGRLGSR